MPDESKSIILDGLLKLNIDTGLHIMQPSHRIKTMEKFYDELRKICPERFISRSTVAEFPFYTNIGRGDLIEFANWRDDFDRQNIRKEDGQKKSMVIA